MSTLKDLHRAVQATLAEKRVGTPVFVRYTATIGPKPQAAITKLATLTHAVRGWLGQPLEQLYAQGTIEDGHVSLTLLFHGGATALVSLVRHLPGERSIDLWILGNHGAIYHDAEYSDQALGFTAPEALRKAIVQALASRKPEAVETEASR